RVLRLPGPAELGDADGPPHVGPGQMSAARRVEVEADVVADEGRALRAVGRARPEPDRVVRIRDRGSPLLLAPAGTAVGRGGQVGDVGSGAVGALLLIGPPNPAAAGGDPGEPLVG